MTCLPRMVVELFFTMCLGCVVATRLDWNPDIVIQDTPSGLQQPDFSNSMADPVIPSNAQRTNYKPNLIQMLLQDREELMDYIKSNQKQKRTRQCYWSAVACF